jgi:hypothetical protein
MDIMGWSNAAMDIMGWSNAAMVKRYAHVTARLRRDIAERLNVFLWSSNEPWCSLAGTLLGRENRVRVARRRRCCLGLEPANEPGAGSWPSGRALLP